MAFLTYLQHQEAQLPCETVAQQAQGQGIFGNAPQKIWARALINEFGKVDYVNNNLAEAFNSKIKKYKGLHIVDLLDKIRKYIMEKFDIRNRIAADHFIGHNIIPSVMKALMAKSKGLGMTLVRRSPTEAEVTATDKEKREWRYPVDLAKWTCSCRQWQLAGKPCIHALFLLQL